MKTCQNCGTSLPDFVNVCTKCKFNLASPPPVKPPAPPAPSAQTSTPPAPRVPPAAPAPADNGTSNAANINSAAANVVAPKKNKMAIYIGVAVLVLVILGWIGANKSGSDEAKLAKEQAAAEVAKAKAEASQAHEEAQKAQEEAEQMKQQAQSSPAASAPINDLLAQAAKCTISNCIGVMVQAANPRNPEAIQVAAGRFGEFNTLKTGDRPASRNLNTQGLAQLRAGNVSGAIDLFNRAALADPNDSEVMGNLAYALVQAGRLEEADKALNVALLINPRRTATWGAVAEFFAKKSNGTENAVRCLQLAYEFSGNRDKTLSFFTDSSATSDRPEMRPVYAEAVRRIRAYN